MAVFIKSGSSKELAKYAEKEKRDWIEAIIMKRSCPASCDCVVCDSFNYARKRFGDRFADNYAGLLFELEGEYQTAKTREEKTYWHNNLDEALSKRTIDLIYYFTKFMK